MSGHIKEMPEKEDILKKQKDLANRAYRKGEFPKALKLFQEIEKQDPSDIRVKLKLAEIQLKLKQKEDALKKYEEVAEAYLREGFTIQAISIYKLILQEEPNRQGINEKLTRLHQERMQVKLGASLLLPKKPVLKEKEEAEPGERQKEMESEIKVAKIPLFSDLNEEEFKKVISRCDVGKIPKGTTIIKEGTKGDAFYVIGSGSVRVFRTLKSGRKVTLARLGGGEFFGEMAYFLGSIRTASVETVEDSNILRFTRDNLSGLIEEHPGIKDGLRKFFKERALDIIFKSWEFFESLEEWEKDALIPEFEMEEKEKDEIIYKLGEQSNYLYFLFKGEVELLANNPDNGRAVSYRVSEGEFFGERGLMEAKPEPEEAVAKVKSLIFKLKRNKVMELIAIHSPMLEKLSSAMDSRGFGGK